MAPGAGSTQVLGVTPLAEEGDVGGGSRPKRRPLGRAFAELHYQLWGGSERPWRSAASVFLGVWIGCLPLYGAHLVLCLGGARLLRLSGLKAYLAAHINNPVTAPFLLYASFGTGHAIFRGSWPALSLSAFEETSWLGLGRDLLAGSIVVGSALAVLAALVAYQVGRYLEAEELTTHLVEEGSSGYVEAGAHHWLFVRGKLRWDPVYMEILRLGIVPSEGRLLDLGCGRGILMAALGAARALHRRGLWSAGWPVPSEAVEMVGVEVRSELLDVARTALGETARLIPGDLAAFSPPRATAAFLLDSLHYLPKTSQAELLEKVSGCLEEGGVLVIREADGGAGARFTFTKAMEYLSVWLRGDWSAKLHFRSLEEWARLIERHGCRLEQAVGAGHRPFANSLLVARRLPEGVSEAEARRRGVEGSNGPGGERVERLG